MGKSQLQRVKELDWVGIILMAVGVVLFLMGVAFGGAEFSWKSSGTISPIVIGILSLVALGIWEWKIAANPFFAHELFIGQARTFPIFLIITFVGGMSLYSAAAFWTQQVQGMWFRDPIKIGLSSIPGGIGGAGMLSRPNLKRRSANSCSWWILGRRSYGKSAVFVLEIDAHLRSCHQNCR
jgi:hypothetical protein